MIAKFRKVVLSVIAVALSTALMVPAMAWASQPSDGSATLEPTPKVVELEMPAADGTTVSTWYDTLQAAFNEVGRMDVDASSTVTLRLHEDVCLPECALLSSPEPVFVVGDGREITLDLNGQSIVSSTNACAIEVEQGGTLNILGKGTISNTNAGATVILNSGVLCIGELGVSDSDSVCVTRGSETAETLGTQNSLVQCTKDSALIINSGVFEGGERSVQAWGEAAIYGGTFLGSVEAWASVVDGVTYGSSIAILGGVFEGPLKTGLYPPDSTVTEYPASIVISGGKFRYDPSEYVQNLGSEYMVTGPVDGYYSVVEYESPEYIPPVYIPPAPVKIPISGDSNSISVNVSISGSVASIDNVDTSQLDGVIGGEAGAQGISVDFSGLSTRVTNVKIPSSVIGQVSDALSDSGNDSEGLKIILPSGTFIEFGAEALKNVASQIEGGDLSLTVLPAGKAPLTDEQREAVGDRPAYDFSLMAGANRISDLGGSVKLGIPYTLGPDERPVNLSALYVAELGETERCESDYSLENQHLVLRTHHFSLYMIGYEEASDFDTCLKDAVCPITPFSDASARAWYHDGVHWALDWGVLKGYGTNGEGGLGPNDFTTRAQVAVMLHRYAQDCGYDVSVGADTNVLSFEDFAEIRTWSMEAIQWAVSEGVLRGYGDGSVLGPNDNVTREQLAVMLHRFAHAYDIDVSVGEDTNILSYADAFDIGEYAIPAMQWACGSGVIRGYDDGSDCLGPKDGASRAQVATMIMRFDSIA